VRILNMKKEFTLFSFATDYDIKLPNINHHLTNTKKNIQNPCLLS
jgi:hypothetical protein